MPLDEIRDEEQGFLFYFKQPTKQICTDFPIATQCNGSITAMPDLVSKL